MVTVVILFNIFCTSSFLHSVHEIPTSKSFDEYSQKIKKPEQSKNKWGQFIKIDLPTNHSSHQSLVSLGTVTSDTPNNSFKRSSSKANIQDLVPDADCIKIKRQPSLNIRKIDLNQTQSINQAPTTQMEQTVTCSLCSWLSRKK